MIGDSDETTFPHKLFSIDRQASRLHKAFANNSPANIKLSKTQLPKIVQFGRLKGINPFELLRLLKEINDHVGTVLLKNTDYLNSYKVIPKLLLNKGLNILSKKKTFINYMFRNNTNKQWDKNIIKVIRPLENLGIFLKRTNKKNY